jgi:hypothetical protein
VANYQARPKPRRSVATIGPREPPVTDLANSPSAEPTITDKAKRRRTITQPGLHPTGVGAMVSAGG